MINELTETKKELARLLTNLGLYYELRKCDGEQLKRYLLDHYDIFLHITHWQKHDGPEDVYNRNGWHYDVIYLKENDNCISQDLQVYPTYDDVLYNGLVESFAFVSLNELQQNP